jgi:Mn-dependent DtxR family transcriptional regulator
MDCKLKGISISAICNEAIWAHSSVTPSTKVDILKAEAQRIEDKQAEIQQKVDTQRAKRLVEFLTKVSNDILNSEISLAYWTKETGKTEAELIKLKEGANNEKNNAE